MAPITVVVRLSRFARRDERSDPDTRRTALRLLAVQRFLRERHWGDECVVFDSYSGETHHLNALATIIFGRVHSSGSVDFGSLAAELSREQETRDAPQISPEDVRAAAAKLRRVGLIAIDESEP